MEVDALNTAFKSDYAIVGVEHSLAIIGNSDILLNTFIMLKC